MKTSLLFAVLSLVCGIVVLLDSPVYGQIPLVADPHELDAIPTDCGNPDANIRVEELRGFNCADLDSRLVGGYSRIRAAGACNWLPYPEPDSPTRGPYGCNEAIESQGAALPEGALDGREPPL